MTVFTCPYCNAQFHGDDVRSGRCPRCEESLPADIREKLPIVAPTSAAIIAPDVKARNRRTAWSIFAMMCLVAVLGLAYALATQSFRRGNDPKLLVTPNIIVQPVGELDLLGFLPKDVDWAGAIKVKELLDTPEGRRLLAEPRPAALKTLLAQVEKWTGQPLDNMDVLAGGIKLQQGAPRVLLATRVRTQFASEALAKHLKATATKPHLGKPTFSFPVQPIGTGRLWYPDGLTLVAVFSFDPESSDPLENVPYPPRSPRFTLGEDLGSLVQERLSKQSFAWIGGRSLAEPLPALLQAKGIQLPNWLGNVELWAASLEFLQGPRLAGQIRAVDEAKAKLLAKDLETRFAADPAFIVTPTPDQPWVAWQRRLSVDALRAAFE